MTYAVKEIFKTIQGEGALAGRVAVFCRFAGCNLWSGRDEDRSDAVCKWCDTDFLGGDKYKTADDLANVIEATWGKSRQKSRMVVMTGGEPALQVDGDLLKSLRDRHFFTAMETNGTIELKDCPDWVCVSPKSGTELRQTDANELKVVFPQDGLILDDIKIYAPIKSLQPMDGPNLEANIQATIAYCLDHPEWKLSLQNHKMVGLR